MPPSRRSLILLFSLIENRSRVVSRDEIFDVVWQGRNVSDTSLSNHIKTARKILGDNAADQKLIKTIRGRGYQFVAEVTIKQNDGRLAPIPSKIL